MKPTTKDEDALTPVAGGEVNGFANRTWVRILDANDLGRLLPYNKNVMGTKAPNIIA